MVYQLTDEIMFPDPRQGEEDGLFAVGGDLSVDRLLLAYTNGIFPWYAFRAEDNYGFPEDYFNADGSPQIRWYCPMQRYVIFPDRIHISHSMRQMLKRNKYTFTIGRDFDRVLHHCSELRIKECGAWLGQDMIDAYKRLYDLNYATSVEVWDENDNLLGGLFGETIGKSFIGESMFSLAPSGSKLALIFLANYMRNMGGTMIDCQLHTPHLESMGGCYISYDKYMQLLKEGCKV